MKFKGLTKLAMSGVALAAVAATLGTSTYAWYVTNSTATASNIIANTQATSSSNLLISKDGTNFSSKFAFTAADFNGGEAGGYAAANINNEFLPVTTSDFSSFTSYTAGSATTSTNYLKFNLWVRSTEAQNASMKLSAVNTTSEPTPQKAYYSTGGVTAGSSFTVDAIDALRMAVIVSSNCTDITSGDTTVNASGTTTYEVNKIVTGEDFTSAYDYTNFDPTLDEADVTEASTVHIVDEDGADTTISAYGAHAYYAAVMGTAAPTSTTTAAGYTSTATNIKSLGIPAYDQENPEDTDIQLTIYIWLEGGDTMCFDACGGQDFTFGLQFNKLA